MRSYYAHLATTATAPSPQTAIAARPVFRSSAIFPVIQGNKISTRILFMGYWILKRNIREISGIVTLRNTSGIILARTNLSITEAKTYRIELNEELEKAGINKDTEFAGSLEIEFFSNQNMFFPFPATVVNYYGPDFSTVVHTAQRVYNDYDDMARNSQTKVQESGFNLYADDDREPFIGLINGNIPTPSSEITLEFVNHDQKRLNCTIPLGNLAPYETKWIYPARHCDLKTFFEGKPGAAKIDFKVNWVFPRLIAGNLHHHTQTRAITHTYYDCSLAEADSDYWRPSEPGWHDASLMVPGELANNHFTNIYFYPIYSPSTLAIDAEIYNKEGLLLGSKQNDITIHAPQITLHQLKLQDLCRELGIGTDADCALRLIARPLNGGRIPSRIKIGLDIGSGLVDIPCNICTNLQPFNPALDNKPTAFRWSPVLANQPKATIWLMNSSPAIDYIRAAELTLTFFRESDDHTISRSVTLPPHGFHILHIAQDQELSEFFEDQIGWVTVTTTNTYTTTYYFTENTSGVVGGDHGF
jgi:hypothetical protein